MKLSDYLIAARKKIEKEENWTQGVYARDAEGHSVPPDLPMACRFCSVGAIMSLSPSAIVADVLRTSLRKAIPAGRTLLIGEYNDKCSHSQVLDLFAEAIAIQLEIESTQ